VCIHRLLMTAMLPTAREEIDSSRDRNDPFHFPRRRSCHQGMGSGCRGYERGGQRRLVIRRTWPTAPRAQRFIRERHVGVRRGLVEVQYSAAGLEDSDLKFIRDQRGGFETAIDVPGYAYAPQSLATLGPTRPPTRCRCRWYIPVRHVPLHCTTAGSRSPDAFLASEVARHDEQMSEQGFVLLWTSFDVGIGFVRHDKLCVGARG